MKHFFTLKQTFTFLFVVLSGHIFGQVTIFDYTGEMDSYTVPGGVTAIQIEVRGAQGGGGIDGVVGGAGAVMIGTFDVTPGEELQILVGGEGIPGVDDGPQAGGTGGGGSYVVNASDEPMIIAGGGGGAMGRSGMLVDGGQGQITEGGQDGEGAGGAGGIEGNGGGTWPWTGWHSGTGGGGFYTDGSADSNGNISYGTINGKGISFLNGGDGGFAGSMGRAGGFGGGGAAGFTGGGGGGYSGGGSGTHDMPAPHSGGGGGSFNDGTDQDNTAGANTGDGLVVITELCEPLAITASASEICLGDPLTLTAEGDGTITWEDGVENGVEFTPESAGTITYTASSDAEGICETTIEILILEAPEITYVTTNEDLGSDGEIDITVTGGVAPYTFDWDNDGTGDFDDTEDLTGLIAGTYTVVVMDDSAICMVTESITVNDLAGIDQTDDIRIEVYPNPTVNNITIQLNGTFEYSVVSISGEVLQSGIGYNSETIAMETYASGTYLIQIVTENGSKNVNVMKL